MKVNRPWDFSPRRAATPPTREPQPDLPEPDPDLVRQRQLQQLRAERPPLARGVEALQVAAWVASSSAQGPPWDLPTRGLLGLTIWASAAWGMHKYAAGQTAWDRVEATGHLALAGSFALTGPPCQALTVVAAGCEALLGGLDCWRGVREKDQARQWMGVAGLISGSALALSVACPPATGLAQAAALLSLASRQALLRGI